jgi:hypothetical protein
MRGTVLCGTGDEGADDEHAWFYGPDRQGRSADACGIGLDQLPPEKDKLLPPNEDAETQRAMQIVPFSRKSLRSGRNSYRGREPGGFGLSSWSKEELRKVAGSDDLHISPFREDGVTYGTPTWIMVCCRGRQPICSRL